MIDLKSLWRLYRQHLTYSPNASPQELANILDPSFVGLTRQQEDNITNFFQTELDKFISTKYKRYHNRIAPFAIQNLRPEFQQEAKRHQEWAMDLIKNQKSEETTILKSHLTNWLNQDPDKRTFATFDEFMKLKEVTNRTTAQMKLVLRDQYNKQQAGLNQIVAKTYHAIGFIWRTMKDKDVTGNPAGNNPTGSDKHQNHYIREGKFYIYKDSPAYKEGYVKPDNKNAFLDTTLADGLPGQPIQCRCYPENLYTLDDINDHVSFAFTKKGYQQYKLQKERGVAINWNLV